MIAVCQGRIVENTRLNEEFCRMTIAAPAIAAEAKPGQFVMVKTSPAYDPFLKRPLSIHRIDRTAGTISLVYQVVGRGTKLMAQMREGEGIELVGPLGNGFITTDEHKPTEKPAETPETVGIVGGGAGIVPLYALAAELVGLKKKVFVMLGAQSADKLIAVRDFQDLGCHVRLATDDGSCGTKGFITALLKELLDNELTDAGRPAMVYACGPLPMLRGVAGMTGLKQVPCQVSLEERMGCGTGACIGCVTKVRCADGSIAHKRVCHDGPVFMGSEVVWA